MGNYKIQILNEKDFSEKKNYLLGGRKNKYGEIKEAMNILEPGQGMVVETKGETQGAIQSMAQSLRKYAADMNMACKVIARKDIIIVERLKKLPGQI